MISLCDFRIDYAGADEMPDSITAVRLGIARLSKQHGCPSRAV